MHYLAGIFDAEGCVSLSSNGGQIISIDMCNEFIPNLFKEKFGGSVSDRKRENRKKIFTWRCPCKNIPFFIDSILPYSFLKKSQLDLMGHYLDNRREDRKNIRKELISKISHCKQPTICEVSSLRVKPHIIPDDNFFKWFAGFLDGDGNFCCYEFKNKFNSSRPNFSTTVSCFNVMPQLIAYIQERIEGSISSLKQNKNPVFKWVCLPKNSIFLCKSILPFIKIKKECCNFMIEFLQIFNSRHSRILGKGSGKGNWENYSFSEIYRLRELIQLIKHQNSL